jgi:CPA1 family monovalent cation:H+ antiporter
MHLPHLIIGLLVVMILSNVINRVFPKVPTPLIQIVLGFALGFTSAEKILEFNSELFLLIVIAPLLFKDSYESDVRAILKWKGIIIFLAFVTAILTVFTVGLTFFALHPTIPIAAAFALGAALGPTDVVAGNSFSKNLKIPKLNKIILQGEGLFNDASGLVTFGVAIAVLETGKFSIIQSGWQLIFASVGGGLIGFVVYRLKDLLTRLLEEVDVKDVSGYLIISIALPFVAYLAAEQFHTSGIIAAVVAGMMQGNETNKASLFEAQIVRTRHTIWHILEFVLNSLVFIFLGVELRYDFMPIIEDGILNNINLIFTVILLTACLFVTRFIAINLYVRVLRPKKTRKFKFQDIIILTLGGVKGTVSIATILMLPTLVNGLPFAARPTILFVCAGTILCSFLVGMLFLPKFADKKTTKVNNEKEIELLREVIKQLEENKKYVPNMYDSEYTIINYRNRIKQLFLEQESRETRSDVEFLRMFMLNIEIDNLDRSYQRGNIDDIAYQMYSRFLNGEEKKIIHSLVSSIKHFGLILRHLNQFFIRLLKHGEVDFQEFKTSKFSQFVLRVKMLKRRFKSEKHIPHDEILRNVNSMRYLYWRNTELIFAALYDLVGIYDDHVIEYLIEDRLKQYQLLTENQYLHRHLIGEEPTSSAALLAGYYLERKVIHEWEQQGKINRQLSEKMRKNVNLLESFSLDDEVKEIDYEYFNAFKGTALSKTGRED